MSIESIISQKHIETLIFSMRGVQVMLDSDLATMFQTETKFINRAMKRNPERFPGSFSFQLTNEEWKNLRFQIGTSKNETEDLVFHSGTSNTHGGRRYAPNVFTEQGVAMLSAVLQTPLAVRVSVQIIHAFVEMRKLLAMHGELFKRVEGIEIKLIEADQKFERIFKALENKDFIPSQGVFFDGQVFDAYELASKIIRSAMQNIVLIDNYMDETTLTHLAKKKKNTKVLLLTKNLNKQLTLDIQKANEQYGGYEAKVFGKSHDRFLIIDDREVYHLGASLKDLGKKWFAFSKMDKRSVEIILKEVTALE